MNVVFRVDASVHIGSGHVMRCLVLAKTLQRQGAKVSFACLPLPSDMRGYISKQGFHVQSLTPPKNITEPTDSADYLGWLQRTQGIDAEDFLSHVSQADWVITDHYAIDSKWQTIVKSQLGCQLLAIDDLVRIHAADIIVDQTLNRVPSEYRSSGLVLAGTDFALLNQSFSENRTLAEKRVLNHKQDNLTRILISMGGIDAPNATLKIVQALDQINGIECTVLLGERSPHFNAVQGWCKGKPHFKHIVFTEAMSTMMLSHDIAIGAPGSTSWERACLGLPSVIIPLAENQQEICRQLVEVGASIKVDIDQIERTLPHAVNQLLKDWTGFVQRNLGLCDGNGVKRVVKNIMELHRENHLTVQ